MQTEREDNLFSTSHERERTRESRETRETEKDPELQAAAAMERADFLVGEVKSSKKQMQNIVMHMQQVLAALRQLREQLQLASDGSSDSSVAHDQERINKLKEKIAAHKDELFKMKDELIAEQKEMMAADGTLGNEALQKEAERVVGKLLAEVGGHET